MKIKIYLIGFVTVLMMSFGCKKTEDQNLDSGFHNVNVYDDTLASFLNYSINIASGSDRMFMTYGIGNSNLVDNIGFGNYYITYGDFAKLIAVDNAGALIWKKTLPTDMIVNDILALDDGGCMVFCLKSDLTEVSKYIYLYRYDANGQNTVNDSIEPAIPSGVSHYSTVNTVRSINGNVILYGIYQPPTGQPSVYACEHDFNLQPIWVKQYDNGQHYHSATACVNAIDGGYLLAFDENLYSNPFAEGRILLRKINSSGDTLWTKYINGHPNAYCYYLKASNSGNYFLSFYSEANDKKQTFIYELNSAGDSLNATSLYQVDHRYNNGLIATDDGGFFALMNSRQNQSNSSAPHFGSISSSFEYDASFSLKSSQFLQTQTNAYFNRVCKTSDGKIAVAGLLQMADHTYYKPAILIFK